MREALTAAIRKTPLYRPLRGWLARRRIARWESKGRPIPPPHEIKERTLREYAETYGLTILVETGTASGTMVEAMRAGFDRVYSIELSRDLYEKAARRFEGVDDVELILGDSGTALASVLSRIDRPALFWLDAHYSGGVTARGDTDTPICAELQEILRRPDIGHVILIDDARCFGTDPAYPSLEGLREFVGSTTYDASISVQDDIIRITSDRSGTAL